MVLEPSSGLNVIDGCNGSGKTSILEGIYILGRGRSFRTQRINTVIREGTDCIEVVGKCEGLNRSIAGIRRCAKDTEIRINGKPARRVSELASLFPVQLVTPRSHEVLEGSPDIRRRFVDWGLFHVEPGFHDLYGRYQRVLKQRNEALKTNPKMAYIWDDQLASWGEQIDEKRKHYLQKLLVMLRDADILGKGTENQIEISLRHGWGKGTGLGEALRKNAEHDRKHGFTLAGPHRSEVVVTANGQSAAAWMSRGQQKMLVLDLVIAQTKMVALLTPKRPILLVDDLPAELDDEARERVIHRLSTIPAQVFITALEEKLLKFDKEHAVFHVEHGRILA